MAARSWDTLDAIAWGDLRHNYGTAEDVPGLLRACAGPDPEAARRAAGALDSAVYHQGGWICPAAPAVLPFLVDLAVDPQSTVRADVIELITNLASEAVRDYVRQVDSAWRPALDAATPSLLGLLDDSDLGIRRAAVYLAGAGGLDVQLALSALRARLDAEPEAGIRYDIVVSLAAAVAGSQPAEATRAVRRGLAAMKRDAGDAQMQLAAVHGLAQLGEPAVQEIPLLVRAVTDAGVTGWQDSSWLGATVASVVTSTGALLAGSPAAALDYAIGVSQRGGAAQRVAALTHLSALLQEWRDVGDQLLPYLAGELAAPEPEVRFRAAYLLGALGRDAIGCADQIAALADDDSATGFRSQDAVSDAAIWALARSGDARAIPYLRSRLTCPRLGFPDVSVNHSRKPYLAAGFTMAPVSTIVIAADPYADLLEAAIGWVRSAGSHSPVAGQFCAIIGEWGTKASAAVPELRRLLGQTAPDRFPGHAAARALGAIGPAAGSVTEELRQHALAGSPVAAWALWRVSGDERDALPVLTSRIDDQISRGTLIGRDTLGYLADFGPLAAPLEGRLRELLQHKYEWTRAEAAQALWRITGDADAAVPVLASLTAPLGEGKTSPVMLTALRYLAAIPGAASIAPQVTETALAILADPRRLAYFGGWRAYIEDDDVRAAAAAYLAA